MSASPRELLVLGSSVGMSTHAQSPGVDKAGAPVVSAVVAPPYKLLLGDAAHGHSAPCGGGPASGYWRTANGTCPAARVEYPKGDVPRCGETADVGCLYHIWRDPGERVNLAAAEPGTFARLLKLRDGYVASHHGLYDPRRDGASVSWGTVATAEGARVPELAPRLDDNGRDVRPQRL